VRHRARAAGVALQRVDCYAGEDGKLVRFRCRVGHAFTAEGVLDGKSEALESALYAALNTLEESAEMADRLLAEGIYVRAFSFPVVPRGKARIRTQMSAAHSRADLDQAITAFEKVRR